MIRKGILFASLTAVISGISIFTNGIFVTRIDPLMFVVLRNSLVAILLTFLIFLSPHAFAQLRTLSRNQWLRLLIIGTIGGGIPFALFFTGLSKIGATNANIINKSLFLWIAILAVPYLKEKLHWIQLIGYGVIFYATFFLGGTYQFISSVGVWMVLGATFLWSVEYVIAKKALKDTSCEVITWGRMVFGLPYLFAAVVLAGGIHVQLQGQIILPIVVSGVLLTGYMYSWYTALSKAPATMVSSVLVLAPVVTIGLNYLFLQKNVTMQQYNTATLVMFGVCLILLSGFMKKARKNIV
jgi:drug/metabolite transporter (DMT)-like permease